MFHSFNQNKADVYVYLALLKNTLQRDQQININIDQIDKFENILFH